MLFHTLLFHQLADFAFQTVNMDRTGMSVCSFYYTTNKDGKVEKSEKQGWRKQVPKMVDQTNEFASLL